MMISPETYYRKNLQGKAAEEILIIIRELRQGIMHLKEILENPDYVCEKKPSELTQLYCMEEYLERAKAALAETGGTYRPTPEEYTIVAFNRQLEYANKITFGIGAYLGSHTERTITIENGAIHLQSSFFPEVEKNADATIPFDAKDIVQRLQNLKLGGWRDYYDTGRFGFVVMDGTGWHLDVGFSNGLPTRRFTGDNAYPYNFQKLQDLFDELWAESFLDV